jgi:outer membrane protein W
MRKVSLVLVTASLIFLFLNSCLANDSTMVRKGKWGISLSASGLSNLGIGLYQGGLGVKHWFSDGLAIKSILSVYAKSSTDANPNPDYTDPKTNRESFAFYLGTEFHFSQESSFSPYFYTGINYSHNATTNYYSIPEQNPTPGMPKKRRTSTNSFGFDGAVGIEYFFGRHFSLAAEYLGGLSFETNKDERTVVSGPNISQPPELKSSSTTLSSKTSSLILTVYF